MTSTDKISYQFTDGPKVEGTLDQIEKIAKTLGMTVDYKSIGVCPPGYYQSESKGLVKISDMNQYHLRQALIKVAREYYTGFYKKDDSIRTFLDKFTALAENPVINALYTELEKRSK